MFKKILIANRGEIAVRVIRACRDMQISPVAVYSEPDAAALHVRMADEAYLLGPAASRESYLRMDKVIEVCKKSGAEAIHPGYGFLSENAEFVQAVQNAGLVFIGPEPYAMEAMGSKTAARKLMQDAGVPVVPGMTEAFSTFEEARDVAAEIGYPVMLKAAAGGGGKGMRLVFEESELKSALETAQSEAIAAFGNGDVYIEKAVVRPRHIEIQVFADKQGNCVYLGERECSIQRRNQKVIEEAPSPINDAELRRKMGETAVKAALAVNYVGAGTVEFLVSDIDRSFYFLEMNTRLQVEHPVTELVTGIDLVREQIRVAAGYDLSVKQEDVVLRGHAIECRVYAEDPANNFLPSPGRISRLRVPHGAGVRDDGGVTDNTEVSIFYDPMISKLAVWGRDRSEAIDRMRRALDEYTVGGIRTTLPFFREIIRDSEFIEGKLDTGFISRWFERRERVLAEKTAEDDEIRLDMALIAAALDYQNQTKTNSAAASAQTGTNGAQESRWKIAGRAALHRSRI
ncbi:MAG TPA: acetyl-CoA carboxylase biotin carboxylase subunit [Pyrinomonadaceae bacterium]|jgi:acetyl-CoA carboxylase biotin carboxylase subunit